MTPYEAVRERFAFPFALYDHQIIRLNEMIPNDRGAFYWRPGTGKTPTSTHVMLHKRMVGDAHRWILAMPPILLDQWQRWLNRVTDLRTGKVLKSIIYYGTPAKRRELAQVLGDYDFILTSLGTFKNDFDLLYEEMHKGPPFGTLVDEAESIKNIKSDNHKAVALMADDERPLVLLTGTPTTKPGDAYAYVKLVAKGLYRNQSHFNRLHVGGTDEYGNVTEWINLDLLAGNLKVHTTSLDRREVRSDLPAVLHQPVHYDLDPAHMKLYRRIAEERLVEFSDGTEIDAISAGALRSALQQVVVNWGEFDENPNRRPAVLDLIENYLEELGEDKLVVVGHFRRTNAYLHTALAKHGAVAIYGDVTATQRQAAIRRFTEDPKCRVIVLQPAAAGRGVDGLQHVCSDMIIVEAPTTSPPYEQVVARLDREGQTDVVNVRIAIANGTVQVRMFNNLLHNDSVTKKVEGGLKDLRASIYGE